MAMILIVATHGRGFWVLDDISALRQMSAKLADAPAHLFKPAIAIRRRNGGFGGTPLPFGSPEAENPPSGAIIDYYLKSDSSDAVTLEILDAAGKTIRKYSSADHVEAPNPRPSKFLRIGCALRKLCRQRQECIAGLGIFTTQAWAAVEADAAVVVADLAVVEDCGPYLELIR